MEEPKQISLIRQVFERLVAEDVQGLLALTDSEPEYHNPEHAVEPGIRRGKDGIAQVIVNVNETLDLNQVNITRWATSGNDQTIVEVQSIGTGRDSGAPLAQRINLHFVFNGNLVKRIEWFRDWEDAVAKVGFDPDTWRQSK